MIKSINVRDITVVQAGLFWFALSFSLINLAVDIAYTISIRELATNRRDDTPCEEYALPTVRKRRWSCSSP